MFHATKIRARWRVRYRARKSLAVVTNAWKYAVFLVIDTAPNKLKVSLAEKLKTLLVAFITDEIGLN